MNITYWAGGYVGLTGAVTFAREGVNVTIYDPDQSVVNAINDGQPKAGEFLAYLGLVVQDCLDAKRLHATSDIAEALSNDIHILAVPSEKDGEPYDAIVRSMLDTLVAHTMFGGQPQVILVESTITPGLIDTWRKENYAVDTLLKPGRLFLAVCPRRDWFADAAKNLESLPRVVGGVDPQSTARAVEILSIVSKNILPTDYRTAELTKPLENALLHLPVMLCHEMALAYPDRDVAQAIELASSHWRFASMGPLYIGCGSGGRCVPLGPRYLQHGTLNTITLATESLRVDADMRVAVTDWIGRLSKHQKSTVVCGIGYRPNFKDAGLSPGLDVARSLVKRGEAVSVCDPMWTFGEIEQLFDVHPVANPQGAEVVLLATPHKQFAEWIKDDTMWHAGQVLIDAQGAWKQHRERFGLRGVKYVRIGEPGWNTL